MGFQRSGKRGSRHLKALSPLIPQHKCFSGSLPPQILISASPFILHNNSSLFSYSSPPALHPPSFLDFSHLIFPCPHPTKKRLPPGIQLHFRWGLPFRHPAKNAFRRTYNSVSAGLLRHHAAKNVFRRTYNSVSAGLHCRHATNNVFRRGKQHLSRRARPPPSSRKKRLPRGKQHHFRRILPPAVIPQKTFRRTSNTISAGASPSVKPKKRLPRGIQLDFWNSGGILFFCFVDP